MYVIMNIRSPLKAKPKGTELKQNCPTKTDKKAVLDKAVKRQEMIILFAPTAGTHGGHSCDSRLALHGTTHQFSPPWHLRVIVAT